ncbi:MAG TPA: sigma-70 family RNA polymerase sigma factor [Bacilli bacterium]
MRHHASNLCSETGQKRGQKLQEWMGANRLLLQNGVINKFVARPEHARLLSRYLAQPDETTKRQLEEAFRCFYSELRFIRYLTSKVRYRAIDFHRKKRKYVSRMLYILDNTDSGLPEALLWADNSVKTPPEDKFATPEQFLDELENLALYNAFKMLTQKQKTITTLTFSMQLRDAEIAALLGITQQTVNKTKKRALRKLKTAIDAQRGRMP